MGDADRLGCAERASGPVLAHARRLGASWAFALQTRLANLALLMPHINGMCTQRFNQRHRKVGHLFQGRFKAVLVDRDNYVLKVCRYMKPPDAGGDGAAPR